MINIIKKKMRGRRPGHNDDNRLSFTSCVHHFPRRLKSLKKDLVELITFFNLLFFHSCFKANAKKSTDNWGGWNWTLSQADVMSGSVPDVLSDSIVEFFPISFWALCHANMETGHSREFRDMETISFWLLYNSTSTCDMPYFCPWNTMLFSRSHILHIFKDAMLFSRTQGGRSRP